MSEDAYSFTAVEDLGALGGETPEESPEGRGRRAAGGGRKTEDRGRRAEGRGRRAENRERRTENRERMVVWSAPRKAGRFKTEQPA